MLLWSRKINNEYIKFSLLSLVSFFIWEIFRNNFYNKNSNEEISISTEVDRYDKLS